MESHSNTGSTSGQMEQYIWASFFQDCVMEEENGIFLEETLMKVNIWTIKKVDRENIVGKMVHIIKEHLKTTIDTDMAKCVGQVGEYIRVNGLMGFKTWKESNLNRESRKNLLNLVAKEARAKHSLKQGFQFYVARQILGKQIVLLISSHSTKHYRLKLLYRSPDQTLLLSIRLTEVYLVKE